MKVEQLRPSATSEIANSFLALPKWVIAWLLIILGPVNMASFFFLDEPGGVMIAALVLAGITLSLAPVFFERGFSKLTALGHLVPWTILIYIIVFHRPEAEGIYDKYLTILAVVNTVSLSFDYIDSYKWLKGERLVLRAEK
ncbi:MAG: hypothetical protein AAF542_16975 [Pseudomonadota bacterium]